MPAKRPDPTPFLVRKHDVVGQDSESWAEFITHVGLAADRHSEATSSTKLQIIHMGPPLERSDEEVDVHAHGCVPLTADEMELIDVFVNRTQAEYGAHNAGELQQYMIVPHCRQEEKADGTVAFRKFSCSGFVIEAYRFAGIDLIVTEPEDLPKVGIDTLLRAYPKQQRQLSHARFRRSLGLEGAGPWPIVLAGYVLNSLRRTEAEIRGKPYLPQPGDEYFPARSPKGPT